MTILNYLETAITENMQLPELVDTFEKMCQMPIDSKEEMLLYETGTFSFTGKELFYFSLVRQFPYESDEYYQLHLDVMYTPNSKNQSFSECIWNVEVDGDLPPEN